MIVLLQEHLMTCFIVEYAILVCSEFHSDLFYRLSFHEHYPYIAAWSCRIGWLGSNCSQLRTSLPDVWSTSRAGVSKIWPMGHLKLLQGWYLARQLPALICVLLWGCSCVTVQDSLNWMFSLWFLRCRSGCSHLRVQESLSRTNSMLGSTKLS